MYNVLGDIMTQLYYPGCRKCYSEQGFNTKLIKDEETGIYQCQRNPEHRYKEGEDGILESI